MNILTISFAAMMLFAPPRSRRDLSSNHWVRDTPRDTPHITLAIVKTQKELENKMRECKWDEKKWPGNIDWEKECAAVISPSKYYEDGILTFHGLRFVPASPERRFRGRVISARPAFYELAYGWKQIDREDDRETRSDGTMVITSGSGVVGEHATLVVSFKKTILDEAPVKPKNLGLTRPTRHRGGTRRR